MHKIYGIKSRYLSISTSLYLCAHGKVLSLSHQFSGSEHVKHEILFQDIEHRAMPLPIILSAFYSHVVYDDSILKLCIQNQLLLPSPHQLYHFMNGFPFIEFNTDYTSLVFAFNIFLHHKFQQKCCQYLIFPFRRKVEY